MSFIDWKDSFDDIFEAYPGKWTLNFLHRNNKNPYEKLKNKRTMQHIGYARYRLFYHSFYRHFVFT